MKKDDLMNKCAKTITNVLTSYLKLDANSASCIIVYQPKTPENLKKLKKEV